MNNKKIEFNLSFVNEKKVGIEEIAKKIEYYLYSAKRYFFLESKEVKDVDDDELILLNIEEKYKKFFCYMYNCHNECFVVTSLFHKIINENNYGYVVDLLNFLDLKDKYLLMAYVLYNKNKLITKTINIKNNDQLNFFISIACRNNIFIDALVCNGTVFVPNTTCGFGVIQDNNQKLEEIKKIANKFDLSIVLLKA